MSDLRLHPDDSEEVRKRKVAHAEAALEAKRAAARVVPIRNNMDEPLPHIDNDAPSETRSKIGGATWPDPIPLTATTSVPSFPVDALPWWAQTWVHELSHETQTPVDMSGMLMLGALATACAGRFRVRVRGTWVEPTNLFLVGVQPPGHRKSAVFRAHERPFAAWEREQAQSFAPTVAAAMSELKAAELRLGHAESKLSKASDPTDHMVAQQDVRDAVAAKLAAERDVPALPRLLCSDITAEQLGRLLYEQGGRMALWDAEGCGPFATMLGRYAEGGQVNFDVFLRGHAGDSYRVDRVKREPIVIDSVALSLVAMAQPEVLRSLGERREARGLGLLARILWFVPDSPVGNRDIEPEPMSASAEAGYVDHITALLNLPRAEQPAEITLAPDAWPELKSFAGRIEPQLGPGGELESVADWALKLAGTVARIAGLLHAADHVCAPSAAPVTADAVRRAIAIGDYLLAHARAAFEQMGTDPVIGDAQHVLRWLRKNGEAAVTGRDLYRGVRGRIKKPADLEPVIELLSEHGWVRVEVPPHLGAGRKPSPVYHVHPGVLSKASIASMGDRV